MKILVAFQSKTGFTKKYAEWIAEDLSCDLKAISDVNSSDIAGYELVIYGGWIMGGMINGLDKVRAYQPKKMIVFGVGFTSKKEVDISKMAEMNKLTDVPLYYFEGGMCPEKMGFLSRMIVKAATKKTPVYEDHASRESIAELVESVNKMNAH